MAFRRFLLPFTFSILITGFFPACQTLSSKSSGHAMDKAYRAFASESDYPQKKDVFRDAKLLAKQDATDKRVRIDLSDQRTQLLVDGKVALDAPCCTGKPGKRTPLGTRLITQKTLDKRSTIFGSLYRNGKKVYGGDRRKYRGRYDRYVGASLPYWMRLTDDGIGIHGSHYVHRYAGSNGCVRMPHDAVADLFAAVPEGTPVEVVN